MRWLGALVVLGCNPAFGIESTRLGDGHEPDAPFVCPTDRSLRFSTLLQVAYPQSCTELSFAAATDLGVAMCMVSQIGQRVFEGPATGELTESVGVDHTLVSYSEVFHAPRLIPDASELYVRVDDYDLDGQQIVSTRYDAYVRSDRRWTSAGTLAFANQIEDALSSISVDPDGTARALLMRTSGLTEWVRRGGTWAMVRTYPMAFIPAVFRSPMLSRDGLQLTAVGGSSFSDLAVMWGSRPGVDVAFDTLTPVPDLPVPADHTVYLTENCGRAYFAGLESVFFAQQQ